MTVIIHTPQTRSFYIYLNFTPSPTTMHRLNTSSPVLILKRSISSSPYGRTHVWRRRAPKLPNPVVPHFPQRVTLADGSTFIHWTTSPRSAIRLTRDNTNNPVWNPWIEGQGMDSIDETAAGPHSKCMISSHSSACLYDPIATL